MESKEELVLGTLFNMPSKQWHFNDLQKETKIASSKLTRWLKKFQKEQLIKKIKMKGKAPYYICDKENPQYQLQKHVFALSEIYRSGLLLNLAQAKCVILFGSFSSWDWYKHSDIDLFIYGTPKDFDLSPYEAKFHREIQIFHCKDQKDFENISKALMRNIIHGVTLVGTIPQEVLEYAQGSKENI